MPKLTRWFLKSSLISFILALFIALLQAARSLLALPPGISALSPIYFHLFMLGWVAQLIFGVVYWMFPKLSKENPRGSERAGWLTFWFLNFGLAARVIAEPLVVSNPHPFWRWVLALSAVLQWLAGMLFAANTWGRVKGR
jgi:cbb3-type cytochrome oxidase subunit 1